MSRLREIFGGRELHAHPDASVVSQSADETLAGLAPGDDGLIASLTFTDAHRARRFFDLGFAPGASVEVIRRAPLGDPITCRVADYEISIRRIDAQQIRLTGSAA